MMRRFAFGVTLFFLGSNLASAWVQFFVLPLRMRHLWVGVLNLVGVCVLLVVNFGLWRLRRRLRKEKR